MYTWGYIKENSLGKLNLTEQEANELGFLSNFPYYANEAMTQICSAVRPNETFFRVVVTPEILNEPIEMPDDFISFNDDVIRYQPAANMNWMKVGDEFVEYRGLNKVICNTTGIYEIPYNARWFVFTKELHNATVIPAPADICDAIPSYIVSQCLKIDDEVKAAIYRNEFEMFLARIDDTSFKSQRTLTRGGGW
jgi:hypothetical protein